MDIIEKTGKTAKRYLRNEKHVNRLLHADPRVKLLAGIIPAVITVMTFNPWKIFFLLVFFYIILLISKVSFFSHISRTIPITILSALVILPVAFTDYIYGILFALRVYISISFLTLFSITTEMDDIRYSMKFFRIPYIMIEMMTIIYRYLNILFRDMFKLLIARESRNMHEMSFMQRWKGGGEMLGGFFIKSFERGERIRKAMISRGHDGRNIINIGTYDRKSTFISWFIIIISLWGWFVI